MYWFFFWYVLLLAMFVPLNCRGGCYFWLDPKVTKRSSQPTLASLPHGPCAANQAKPGLQNFALLRSLQAIASANIAMPYSRTWPASFCLISGEAGRLTGGGTFGVFCFYANHLPPAFTHPVIAALDHPLFAARKEGIFFYFPSPSFCQRRREGRPA
jgi:hypothetical protein